MSNRLLCKAIIQDRISVLGSELIQKNERDSGRLSLVFRVKVEIGNEELTGDKSKIARKDYTRRMSKDAQEQIIIFLEINHDADLEDGQNADPSLDISLRKKKVAQLAGLFSLSTKRKRLQPDSSMYW